jgi:hypothetical protein
MQVVLSTASCVVSGFLATPPAATQCPPARTHPQRRTPLTRTLCWCGGPMCCCGW